MQDFIGEEAAFARVIAAEFDLAADVAEDFGDGIAVFVHLADDAGIVMAQADGEPTSAEGRAPSEGATFVVVVENQKVLDAVRISGTERRWVRP